MNQHTLLASQFYTQITLRPLAEDAEAKPACNLLENCYYLYSYGLVIRIIIMNDHMVRHHLAFL